MTEAKIVITVCYGDDDSLGFEVKSTELTDANVDLLLLASIATSALTGALESYQELVQESTVAIATTAEEVN